MNARLKIKLMQRGEAVSRVAHNHESPVRVRPLLPIQVAKTCARTTEKGATEAARPGSSPATSAPVGRPRFSEFLQKRVAWWWVPGWRA